MHLLSAKELSKLHHTVFKKTVLFLRDFVICFYLFLASNRNGGVGGGMVGCGVWCAEGRGEKGFNVVFGHPYFLFYQLHVNILNLRFVVAGPGQENLPFLFNGA